MGGREGGWRARSRWRWGFGVVAAACVVASCLAYGGVLRLDALGVPHLDFYGHMVFMGLLAFFLDGLVRHRALAGVPIAPLLVLAAASTDEVLQRFSSHRSSTWSDFVADVIGVTIGALVAARVARGLKVCDPIDVPISPDRGRASSGNGTTAAGPPPCLLPDRE